jgi:K+-sensing histidine kinase KdpD
MSTVVSYVEQFNPEAATPNEPEITSNILKNSDYLLHLIDNILHLSRLQARMVEIVKRPQNFAELFEAQCNDGWARYQNADTRYIVENPYEVLMVDIDCENLGHVIRQLTSNAAMHTHSGTIRTRCEFIGRRLVISVDDTGMGIPADELARLNQPATANQSHTTKGLGLSICRELVSQMNGTFEIISEKGAGTTIYVSIPCHASIIKRKRN